MISINVPLIIRGEVIEDYETEFVGRGTGLRLRTPEVKKYLGVLLEGDPLRQADLYEISLQDIIDFIEEVGKRLDLDKNSYWREAFEASCLASNLSRPVLENVYRTCGGIFAGEYVRDFIEARFGGPQILETWVPRTLRDGRIIHVRAMGARGVHVIAGNVPVVATATLLRCAVTRSDAIVKLPSNDPLTMVALAKTMIDIDAKHPLTRHLSVAYWKGGNVEIESEIYQPTYIEKIVSWGGFASIKHITRYLQPGLDLITADPKNSATLIGREAFADDMTMREVARRAAADVGGWDQEACLNARILYIESGTGTEGIAAANRFGQYLYEALQDLPRTISSGPVRVDPVLLGEVEKILPLKDSYRIYGNGPTIAKTGAVIVSQVSAPVKLPVLLYGRICNLVPMDRIEDAVDYFTAATQTVGIYPDSLRVALRDKAALKGGQMFVPVGYALTGSLCAPGDAMEAERRMCRWVVDTHCDPATVPGPWMHAEEIAAVRGQEAGTWVAPE